jgi:hypothetical protein
MRIVISAVTMASTTILALGLVLLPLIAGDHHIGSEPKPGAYSYYFSRWQLSAAFLSWVVACVAIAYLAKKQRQNIALVIPVIWTLLFWELWMSAVEETARRNGYVS